MERKDVKGILYGKVGDFAEKVAPIYKLLDWRWSDSDLPPAAAEIEQALQELIEVQGGRGRVATGGLEVFYDEEDREIGISFSYGDSTYF